LEPLELGAGDWLLDGSALSDGEAGSGAVGEDDWVGAGMFTLPTEATRAELPSRRNVRETVPLPAKTPSNSVPAASTVPSAS
jgi:hypothetical protein